LLAIADPKGLVVGTDIALARRLNMPLERFQSSLSTLMEPDPNSNSLDEEGRRLTRSEGERGYQIVNYLRYRNTRDEDHRREYMRQLMAEKRKKEKLLAPVSTVNNGKQVLAQAEAESVRVLAVPANKPSKVQPTKCQPPEPTPEQ